MAQFRKRPNGNWQAVIRKAKYPDQRKTFKTKSAARAWARKVVMQMDEGWFVGDKDAVNSKLALEGDVFSRNSLGCSRSPRLRKSGGGIWRPMFWSKLGVN